MRSLPSGSWLLRPPVTAASPAADTGSGMQRGGLCCAPFALRRRRSSKSYSVTRQQLVQLWQASLALVQAGSGLPPRPPAALAREAAAPYATTRYY